MVLTDDRELVRSGFRLLVESEPDMEGVGEASDGNQAAGLAESLQPVTRRLVAEFVRRPATTARGEALIDLLTDREREVMTLVARGLSNDEIAERLFSPATARIHVSRCMTKLAARDRAQLVVLAYQTGLVSVDGAREP